MLKNQEEQASIFSKIFFTWVFPLLRQGQSQNIQQSELLKLRSYETYNSLVYQVQQQQQQQDKNNTKEQKSLQKILLSINKQDMTLVIILYLVVGILQFMGPISIKHIIRCLNENMQVSMSIQWCTILFVTFSIRSILSVYLNHRNEIIATKYLYIIEQELIRKTTKLTISARFQVDSGKIISLLTVDSNAVHFLLLYAIQGLTAPITIIIALIYIIVEIGWIGLLGPAIIFILLLIQNNLQTLNTKYKSQGLTLSDKRAKYIKEFFSGIKILKVYAWEDIIVQQLQSIRQSEKYVIFKILQIRAIIDCLFELTPILISIIVFSVYVTLGYQLNATKAFTLHSLFSIFQIPARMMAFTYATYKSTKVSFDRINQFLQAEEYTQQITQIEYQQSLNKGQILLQKCNFRQNSHNQVQQQYTQKIQQNELIEQQQNKIKKKNGYNQFESEVDLMKSNNKKVEQVYCFKDIDIQIEDGQLIGIIGEVGAGKTTLLNCIMNEMYLESGTIKQNGKIAYVPQQSWLRNDTIRENICFGLIYIEDKYNKILEICELIQDLEMLPGGDQTEIGERGINLSGGQKQRISIARALYSESDIYIFDDSFSALDMRIGPKIFQNVIQKHLHNSTRIIVTHSLYLIPKFDNLIIVKDLQVVEVAPYQQLLAKSSIYLQSLIPKLNKESYTHQSNYSLQEENHIIPIPQQSASQTLTKQSNGISQQQIQLGILIQEEETHQGQIPFKVYKNYLFGNSIKLSVFTTLFFVFSQQIRLLSDWWLAVWSSNYFEQSAYFYIELYIILFILAGFLTYLRGYLFALLASSSSYRIFNEMIKSLVRSPLQWFDITPIGRIINICTKDQDEIDYWLPIQITMSFIQIFQAFSCLLLVCYVTPSLIYIFGCILILFYILIKYFLRINIQIRRILIKRRSPVYSLFTEILNGAQIIRVFQQGETIDKLIGQRLDEYHQAIYNQNSVNNWMAIQVNILCILIVGITGYLGIYINYYYYQHTTTTHTNAMIALSLSSILNVVLILSYAIKLLSISEMTMSSVQRILQYSQSNPQERDFHVPKPPLNWPSSGRIIAQDLTYRYRQGLPIVLQGISFTLNHGDKLGVCGRSGSGKSTLLLGLLRIIELTHDSTINSNRYIKYDNQIIEELGLHELRKNITIIPQDPLLFSGSLKYNLDPFNQYTEVNIENALKKSQIWEHIPQCQNKLEYQVGEDGMNFSFGQRQLICLARALLRKPKILLMDEATASIDEKTDFIIQNMIQNEFADCTVITIAHRLNTIATYHKILVLKDGTIAEFDTPQNLINNQNSEFYKMIQTQGNYYINRMQQYIR